MIDEVITQDGRKISADEAVALRERAKLRGETPPIYMDPDSGETVLRPRKGHESQLSHARTHFYTPSEIREKGIGKERKEAVESLEDILKKSGNFVDFKRGLLEFSDVEANVKYDSMILDFDYGFQVLFAKNCDGKQHALLVLNRVPNSNDYLNLLKSLGNRELFEGEPKIEQRLVEENGEKIEINGTIYLTTVQLKNDHLFRLNTEEQHPKNAILLGDWQSKHLSTIYPEFVYFDKDAKKIEVVNLKKFPHSCLHSGYRYGFKNKEVPKEGSEFCRLANSVYGKMDSFDLKPLEIKKDSLKSQIGNHPRLYVSRVIPSLQRSFL